MAAGVISRLWRYPVKSMGGERVGSMRVDWRGAGGDRTHAVLFARRGQLRRLTAREAPRLLAYTAGYPTAPDGELDPGDPPFASVTDPRGVQLAWDDPQLEPRLREDLGREVKLRRDLDGQQDLGRTLLVTVEATLRALEAELEMPVDLQRFRSNVHLDLDTRPWAEHGWEGRTLRLDGGVVLELLHPCERCVIPTRDPRTLEKWPQLLRHLAARHDTAFGINARVTTAGRLSEGQAVTLD